MRNQRKLIRDGDKKKLYTFSRQRRRRSNNVNDQQITKAPRHRKYGKILRMLQIREEMCMCIKVEQ